MNTSSEGPQLFAAALRSSNIERTVEFLTGPLGMSVLRTYTAAPTAHGPYSEGATVNVVLGFKGDNPGQNLFIFSSQNKNAITEIEHGNGLSRIMLLVPSAEAIASGLTAAGYEPCDIRETPRYKVLFVSDPDGYQYELLEVLARLPSGQPSL